MNTEKILAHVEGLNIYVLNESQNITNIGKALKIIVDNRPEQAPAKLLHLIKLLSQYIGQPISSSKLASDVGLNQKTVDRYLDLLEKTFVIKKIMPFANKMSQSLKFKPKYYFYDLGIRNVSK